MNTMNAAFGILVGRARGLSSQEAVRAGLTSALMSNRPLFGLVLVSAMSQREASSTRAAPSLPAPAAPIVTAVALVDPNAVVLTWSPVAKANSYDVRRSSGNKKPETNNVKVAGYFDPDVKPGTKYTYVIEAFADDTSIGVSVPVSVTTPGAETIAA